MSLKNKTVLENKEVKLEVEVGAEAFESAVEKAYQKNKKNITLPGFRKGKATRKMIERVYGAEVFYEDAINIVYPEAYAQAVEEADIEPVDNAKVEIDTIGKEGFTFTATVVVKPEVELGKYKGIEVDKYIRKVTDEDIDAELTTLRERGGRQIDITDRASENGDTLNIDFEGFVDGVPFDGGKAEGYDLKLGSGSFIPGFEEQLVGKNVDDQLEVNVKFPDDYHAENLAGKDAVFQVKIHAIKATELPELDDEFAKDVSEFDTLDELKKDIADRTAKARDDASNQDVEDKIVNAVIDDMKVEIPPVMIERELDSVLMEFEYRLSGRGLDMDSYLKYTGMDKDAFRESMRPQAEKRVKTRLAFEKIIAAEELSVDEEAFEKAYEEMAKQYNIELDQVKQFVKKEDLENDLLFQKVMAFLKDEAKITEKDFKSVEERLEESKQKAAAKKKTTARKPRAKKADKPADDAKEADAQPVEDK